MNTLFLDTAFGLSQREPATLELSRRVIKETEDVAKAGGIT